MKPKKTWLIENEEGLVLAEVRPVDADPAAAAQLARDIAKACAAVLMRPVRPRLAVVTR